MLPALKISPRNLLDWSNMEDWVNGTSSAPTEHTLAGAGATISREASIVKQGTYSAKLTRAGADCSIYHDYTGYASYLGRKMTFGCWVYATAASRARISINDGTTTTSSSYHTGGSSWEYLTVTADMSATATRIRCSMEVNTGDTAAYFDGGILVEGATTFTDLSTYLEEWKPSQKIRMSSFVIPRRAGIIIPLPEYGEKSLSLNGKIYGATQTLARTAFDALIQSITNGEKDLYLYDDRLIRGYLSSQDNDYIAAMRAMKFSLKFTAQRPFFYFLQNYRSQQTISSSPTTFTVTNNGSVVLRPDIRFVAGGSDITSCTLENLTTGQTFTFTATVTAGNTLQINCAEAYVLNNAVDSLQYFTGDFLYLNPGANQIKFTGSNCTIKFDTRDAWL